MEYVGACSLLAVLVLSGFGAGYWCGRARRAERRHVSTQTIEIKVEGAAGAERVLKNVAAEAERLHHALVRVADEGDRIARHTRPEA